MNEFSDDLRNLTGGVDDSREIAELVRTLTSELIGLAGLELRLFGHTLLAIVICSGAIFLALLVCWLFMAAALAVTLSDLQAFNVTGALLTVAAVHLLIAWLILWRVKRLTTDLRLRETRSAIVDLASKMKNADGVAGHRSADPKAAVEK